MSKETKPSFDDHFESLSDALRQVVSDFESWPLKEAAVMEAEIDIYWSEQKQDTLINLYLKYRDLEQPKFITLTDAVTAAIDLFSDDPFTYTPPYVNMLEMMAVDFEKQAARLREAAKAAEVADDEGDDQPTTTNP